MSIEYFKTILNRIRTSIILNNIYTWLHLDYHVKHLASIAWSWRNSGWMLNHLNNGNMGELVIEKNSRNVSRMHRGIPNTSQVSRLNSVQSLKPDQRGRTTSVGESPKHRCSWLLACFSVQDEVEMRFDRSLIDSWSVECQYQNDETPQTWFMISWSKVLIFSSGFISFWQATNDEVDATGVDVSRSSHRCGGHWWRERWPLGAGRRGSLVFEQ